MGINYEKNELLRYAFSKGDESMGWMIMNCWQKLIERLDLSSCGLTDMPSLPSRHCKTIKELDISSNYIQ